MDSQQYLKDLFRRSLAFCSPSNAIDSVLSIDGEVCVIEDLKFNLREQPIYVLAVGKASVMMFNSVQRILGEHISGSLVITSETEDADRCQAHQVMVGSHPTPDEDSLEAGKAAVDFLSQLPENALVLCLISGGTSSLMCLPAEDISIADLNKTYDLLNNSGASIHEINTVRKHCSSIKGGQLLRFFKSSVSLVELVISDVPDDDLASIGSGPTTPDASNFQDAYHILLEFELWEQVPESVRNHLEKGIEGEVHETLRPEKDPLAQHHSFIVSSAQKLAERFASLARTDGYEVWVADKAFNDQVENIADSIAQRSLSYLEDKSITRNSSPHLFIYYGESYVKVTGSGKGGRNQELALRGALKIDGKSEITWLSAGTDGVDGPTDAAGAIVDGRTIQTAHKQGLNPSTYLQNNDSYHFHKELGTLYKTGPTGNNLMDVTIIAIE